MILYILILYSTQLVKLTLSIIEDIARKERFDQLLFYYCQFYGCSIKLDKNAILYNEMIIHNTKIDFNIFLNVTDK
jgi:hypothetical protein